MFFLQILLNSIVLGTKVLLIAVPLYLVYSISKVFHLGLGAISTAMAYTFYITVKTSGSFLLATLISILVGILFAIGSYYLLENYVERKQYLFALLASFSAGMAIEALIAIIFGSGGKNIIEGVLPVIHFWGLNLTIPGLAGIISGALMFCCMAFVLHKTPFGRFLRSLAENAPSAESLGINSHRLRFITYLIAVLFAGFVGIMFGMNSALTPLMGLKTTIWAFIAFLIGGTTNIMGTLIASYLIVFVSQFITSFTGFSMSWETVFVFISAAVMLLIWPKGLFYSSARNK